MSGARRSSEPPAGPTAAAQPLQAPARPNRLSRSLRQTQQESPRGQQSEFKTPTRIRRPRAGGGFSGESPHNDSDVQHDIIWDATSPSPSRLGKRGKKQPPGVVNISEIVSRIAPKHGRPQVAEPTLQQWIGDSAAIPCTLDVQVPKPKKKSPRPNGVDDLLKLAKQFDFNMFHQDEEEVEDQHQQSLEDPSEEILDLENDDREDFSPSLPGNCQPAVKAAAGADMQLHLDQHMEDDLDFLFDGPTQHVSGNLSQVSSAQPSQVKPASGSSSKEASGKPPSSHGPTSGVSSTNTKGALAVGDFEDDWEDDDLLNDSLVLEMTQNPQIFAAPMHCSTQKPPSELNHQRESKCNPLNVAARGGVGLAQLAVSKVEKNNERQRTTFKLESNPEFSVKRIQTDKWTTSKTADKRTQNRFPSGEGASVEAGSAHAWQTSTHQQKPQFHQRTSAASAKYNTTAFTVSNSSATQTAQSFPQKPAVASSHSAAPAASDLLDEDLSSFFLSDPVWDDPADDDLLCEMCEDVENQIQSSENAPTKWTPPRLDQRAALQPANKTWDNSWQTLPTKQMAGGPADRSLTAGFCAQTNTVTDSFRYKQAKNTSGSTSSSACLRGSSEVQSAPQGNLHKDQFTFKKPNNPVSTVTNKVLGKCSAAEIELKKQQAMERRRQRLQAAQNLRAPT